MAVTPSWRTNAKGEEEYYDKGAVTEPQINVETDRKYTEAETQANAADYVEWPTAIHGQTDQGM